MTTVKRTSEYDKWFRDLRDQRAKVKIFNRIDRLLIGNPGDVEPIGEGVSEMRIDSGPGYRVYFLRRGKIVTLLFGGDKDSQTADIRCAIAMAREVKE